MADAPTPEIPAAAARQEELQQVIDTVVQAQADESAAPADVREALNARRGYAQVAFVLSVAVGVGGPLWLLVLFTFWGGDSVTVEKSLLVLGMLGFAYALLRAADRFSLDERIIERIEIARASRRGSADERSPTEEAITLLNTAVDAVAKLKSDS